MNMNKCLKRQGSVHFKKLGVIFTVIIFFSNIADSKTNLMGRI